MTGIDEVILCFIKAQKLRIATAYLILLQRRKSAKERVKTVRLFLHNPLREQVKRNKERFPANFMFQLTKKETEYLVSQNAIPSKQHLGGHLPFVFTEHGVLMLANVIKSKLAIKMSIRIIEVFVKMRKMLLTHKDILLKLGKLEESVTKHDKNIQLIFEYLKQFEEAKQKQLNQKNRKKIGFN